MKVWFIKELNCPWAQLYWTLFQITKSPRFTMQIRSYDIDVAQISFYISSLLTVQNSVDEKHTAVLAQMPCSFIFYCHVQPN